MNRKHGDTIKRCTVCRVEPVPQTGNTHSPHSIGGRCESCKLLARDNASLSESGLRRIPVPSGGLDTVEVAKALGLTFEGVRQIEKRALHKLRIAAKRLGITLSDILR